MMPAARPIPITTPEAVVVPTAEPIEDRITRLGDHLLSKVMAFVRTADVAVVDTASLEQATELRAAIGAMEKEAEAYFEPEKKRFYGWWKAACARENAVRDPLKRLDTKIKTAISDYLTEQTRQREARERELAETQRKLDHDRALAEAAALATCGDHALAEAVVAEAIAAPMPVVVLKDETKSIVSTVRRWYWRFSGGPKDITQTPPKILVRSLNLIPREFLCVDEKKVGAYVRSMKSSAVIPGIDVFYVDEPVRR
jgi:hypothetical protein